MIQYIRQKKKKEIHLSVCESAPETAKITNGKVAELTNSRNDDYFFFLSTMDSHYEAESQNKSTQHDPGSGLKH